MALKNLTGKKFNRLLVDSRAENAPSGAARWHCTCDCGGKTIVTSQNLTKNSTKSCGCLKRERVSIGELTQEKLKELLHYNPDTGIFKWNKGGKGKRLDRVAGNLNKSLGYITIRIDYKSYYAHRLAWFYTHGVWSEKQTDHINHCRHDNRLCNLREVTHVENQRNAKFSKNNTSGVTGVTKAKNRWRAKIYKDGNVFFDQCFASKHKAIAIRKALEVMLGYHNNHGSSP